MMTLRDVVQRLTEERVDLSDGQLYVLRAAVRWYERACADSRVETLSAANIRKMMRAIVTVRSRDTVNNYRARILYLWRQSRKHGAPSLPDPGEVPRLRGPQRLPTAWRPDQLCRIMEQCSRARQIAHWGPEHWEALVLTVYDTSLRIGCLRKSDVGQLEHDPPRLRVPAEFQKGGRDTYQPLHPETAEKLSVLYRPPGDRRLFPWPYCPRQIWIKFRSDILIPAGLPATRRDQFHKIRRTSYTLVYVKHGLTAAMEHASHTEDLSRYYLDPTFLEKPNPLDALPRPA